MITIVKNQAADKIYELWMIVQWQEEKFMCSRKGTKPDALNLFDNTLPHWRANQSFFVTEDGKQLDMSKETVAIQSTTINDLKEVDALTAEFGIGLEVFRGNGESYLDDKGNDEALVPRYSTDETANEAVVRKLLSQGIGLKKVMIGGKFQVTNIPLNDTARANHIT